MAAAVVVPASSSTRRRDEPSAKATMLPLDEPVCLRRFGLNFDPPSLVLEYERLSTGRLFHRRIGLRRLGPGVDATRTAEKIRRQNKALLAEDQVPFEQLVSVVARLCQQGRLPQEEAKPSASSTAAVAGKADETEDVRRSPSGEACGAIAGEAAEEGRRVAEETAEEDAPAAAEEAPPSPVAGDHVEGEGEAVEHIQVIDGELNLNKLSDEQLEEYKRRMDVDFRKHQRKPGDPGFVYDVRVDHEVDANAEDCGWDDSEED
mmetsp:Transcript_26638/g.75614  ORF Transcript_26638/g.75614 Transcript_26638/m.75614 type:complete len:262 (+) Transcript_26638:81-866(+)